MNRDIASLHPSRFNILLATEMNRLRRHRDAAVVHDVAKALGVEDKVSAWSAQSVWITHVEQCEGTDRCPNPRCGAPVGHIHICPPV
jgi:hypothetical protein